MLDPGTFKAYDVRGIYPTQIDEDGAYAVGRAFAAHLEPVSVAVSRDMRTMAPSVSEALIEGIRDGGVDVIDIGQAGTEMLYFAVADGELDGGVQVTASHNPGEYIGMKIVRRGALPIGGDTGLMAIRDLAGRIAMSGERGTADGTERGSLTQRDVSEAFHAKVLSFVDVAAIRPLTVVMDAGSGLGGWMIEPLLAQLPITVHRYNFTPDGTFPNHEPNPLLEENRQFIIERVREHGADLGIAWDGDADRCFFIDDQGEFVPGDFITAVLAELTLRRSPSATILYDVRASRAVPNTIEEHGGTAIASRVGHAFIKATMRSEDAAFAGEVSGHYYFRDFYSVDTGIVPALMMLQLVSESGGTLSDLVADLRSTYFITGEINSTVADIPMKLQQLKERYRDGKITHLDGVSVDYDDWHFNVRSSNTEPLLRLNLEAESQDEMETKRDEVLGLIRSDSTARI